MFVSYSFAQALESALWNLKSRLSSLRRSETAPWFEGYMEYDSRDGLVGYGSGFFFLLGAMVVMFGAWGFEEMLRVCLF